MNLEAIRRILLMTPADAARVLAATEQTPDGVSETTWNRWENGVKDLPADVWECIDEALAKRAEYLLPLLDDLRMELRQGSTISIDWITNTDKEDMDELEWYLLRSAHAELIALGADSEVRDG